MEKYDIILTVISSLWIFLLGWVLKIQKDMGKLRQNEINIMTDLIEIKNKNDKFVPKIQCDILHAVNENNIKSLKDDITGQLKDIKENQFEMQKDIKELLKR
jgi:hypothetical protein